MGHSEPLFVFKNTEHFLNLEWKFNRGQATNQENQEDEKTGISGKLKFGTKPSFDSNSPIYYTGMYEYTTEYTITYTILCPIEPSFPPRCRFRLCVFLSSCFLTLVCLCYLRLLHLLQTCNKL